MPANATGGGRIRFDSAVLFPPAGSELARLPLRARIEAILIHEVVEANVAARLGLTTAADITHVRSLLLSPYSELARRAGPEVVAYLRLWAQRGGGPP